MPISDSVIVEKILRSVVVYLFLLVSFPLAVSCFLGQLTAFELRVLVIITNVLREPLDAAWRRAGLGKRDLMHVNESSWATREKDCRVGVIHRGAPAA